MIENYLNTQGYMLFDGAFGTYYAQRYAEDQKPCEMANLNHPKRVAAIHQEYISKSWMCFLRRGRIASCLKRC